MCENGAQSQHICSFFIFLMLPCLHYCLNLFHFSCDKIVPNISFGVFNLIWRMKSNPAIPHSSIKPPYFQSASLWTAAVTSSSVCNMHNYKAFESPLISFHFAFKEPDIQKSKKSTFSNLCFFYLFVQSLILTYQSSQHQKTHLHLHPLLPNTHTRIHTLT